MLPEQTQTGFEGAAEKRERSVEKSGRVGVGVTQPEVNKQRIWRRREGTEGEDRRDENGEKEGEWYSW